MALSTKGRKGRGGCGFGEPILCSHSSSKRNIMHPEPGGASHGLEHLVGVCGFGEQILCSHSGSQGNIILSWEVQARALNTKRGCKLEGHR